MNRLAKKPWAYWLVVLVIAAGLIVGVWWMASFKTFSPPTNTTNNTAGDKNPASTANKELEDCLLQASSSDANAAVIEEARQHCYETYH